MATLTLGKGTNDQEMTAEIDALMDVLAPEVYEILAREDPTVNAALNAILSLYLRVGFSCDVPAESMQAALRELADAVPIYAAKTIVGGTA